MNRKYSWKKNATLVNMSVATYAPFFMITSLMLYFAPKGEHPVCDIYLFGNLIGLLLSYVLNNNYLYVKNHHVEILKEFSRTRLNFYANYVLAILIGVMSLGIIIGSIFLMHYFKFGYF